MYENIYHEDKEDTGSVPYIECENILKLLPMFIVLYYDDNDSKYFRSGFYQNEIVIYIQT